MTFPQWKQLSTALCFQRDNIKYEGDCGCWFFMAILLLFCYNRKSYIPTSFQTLLHFRHNRMFDSTIFLKVFIFLNCLVLIKVLNYFIIHEIKKHDIKPDHLSIFHLWWFLYKIFTKPKIVRYCRKSNFFFWYSFKS